MNTNRSELKIEKSGVQTNLSIHIKRYNAIFPKDIEFDFKLKVFLWSVGGMFQNLDLLTVTAGPSFRSF